MKKFALLSALAAAVFVATSASAVMGVFTISGTVQSQSFNNEVPAIQKLSISQKNLLFILEQGTGDASITNKPTKIYYDPDAYNTNIVQAVEIFQGETNAYFGIFYYSNSVSGLVKLDGGITNETGVVTNYYSYMELDYRSAYPGFMEGFWNPAGMEANSVEGANSSESSFTDAGNAILYVHSDPSKFNLLGNWTGSPQGYPSQFYFANDAYTNSFQQSYAAVIHGPMAFKLSYSQGKNTTTESESFTVKGSGDVNYNNTDGIINGTVTFTGKGPADLP